MFAVRWKPSYSYHLAISLGYRGADTEADLLDASETRVTISTSVWRRCAGTEDSLSRCATLRINVGITSRAREQIPPFAFAPLRPSPCLVTTPTDSRDIAVYLKLQRGKKPFSRRSSFAVSSRDLVTRTRSRSFRSRLRTTFKGVPARLAQCLSSVFHDGSRVCVSS